MKLYFTLFILISICFNSFCQEKVKIYPFVNPQESNPRFTEDIGLSESENKLIFKRRILSHFLEHLNEKEFSSYLDSINTKIYISFKIDTLGISKFHKIYPKKFEGKYLVNMFSAFVDSLPKFIPVTQRNKAVNIIYSIPILKNK